MINNRQNGRRRGRGSGPRPPSGMSNQGNRQDNRSRGNAAQLHEKYKALARDSQLAGDRVQTEYFLQFADHYYRVLNESRARFEEQRRQRDDYDDDEDQDEGMNAADQDEGQDGDAAEERQEPRRRRDAERSRSAGPREPREQRGDEERAPREAGEEREQRNGSERRPRRERPRREEQQPEADGEERISLEALPPAIATDGDDNVVKTPRRRTRRPRPDGGEAEIAPAA